MLATLLTSGASAVLGGVMRFLSDNAKDRRLDKEMQHEHLMALSKVNAKDRRAARKDANKPISKTRRFVVIAVITSVIAMMFVAGVSDMVINVPVSSEGFSIFGLVFGDGTTYTQLSGFVLIPEVVLWGTAIVSFLFGSNVVKR